MDILWDVPDDIEADASGQADAADTVVVGLDRSMHVGQTCLWSPCTDPTCGLYRLFTLSDMGWLPLGTSEPCGGGFSEPMRVQQGTQTDSVPALSTMPVELPGIVRLRRRSKWAAPLREWLGLEDGFLGAFLRGRWTPDLPGESASKDARFLAALIKAGVKVLGSGQLEVTDEEKDESRAGRPVTFITLGLGGGVYTVIPELLARLSSYACFRTRDAALVAALRLRALEWCRARSLDPRDGALCIPQTVALAVLETNPEAAAETLLGSRAVAGNTLFPWVSKILGSKWWKLRA